MEIIAFMLISFYILISYSQVSGAEDTVTQSHPLTDGNTLISKNGSFEMGFFSPANSSSRYLGIWVWQKNIPVKHVIWVANKEKPIEDLSGLLMINSTGNVVLLSQNNTVVWSKTPIREVQNPVLQLLDSGNLVLREEETEENSEKYLCQSLDFSSIRRLIAEKTQNGLSPGNLARRADIANFCDSPRVCGPNGGCDVVKAPNCYCLKGFQPKSPNNWKNYDNTDGCVRTETLNCSTDGFVKYVSLKLPNSTYSFSNQTNNLKECEQKCMSNCSCMAYASSDINGSGTGCAMWYDDLIDVKLLVDGGKDLYIRMAASELVTHDGHMVKTGLIIGSAVALISGMILAFYYIRRKKRNSKGHINEEQEEDLELPLYGLSKIARATGNFSINNKLGEGGFGPVYMGTLDGRDIAVKRLSKSSGQGIKEFKNEVILISKLQHRNLVKLLGCSIQDKEKLLIYEYMPNKSLDSFIFDQTRRKLLDWSKRFHIICGIARGLLYLHQDSRLRIIHRDLKASNVLLDSEMNPKISDFGLARICGEDQTAGNTNRVVGTYGYMAPEYAIDGRFSVKSDVFSFGILLLEIVTGKKNRGFYCPNESVNLVGHAWNLWKEGRPLELVDNCMGESCDLSEVLRCIHISILCMQQHPQDRPNMSSVIMMLENAADIITSSQNLTEGKTLISKTGIYELGFFNTGNSSKRYLGIWYKNIAVQTVVWVANGQTPIKDLSGLLMINSSRSNLVLSQNKTVIWSAILKRKPQNSVLQLLDSGNLVLREANDENSENYLWQSFDYPSDTLLPGMKLGKDLRTGLDRRVTAWKNPYDPSPGNLTWTMHVDNYPEPFMFLGSKKFFRSGPWIGVQYSGQPTLQRHPIFEFKYFNDGNEVYYMFLLRNKSRLARMTVNQTTYSRFFFLWLEPEQTWQRLSSLPRDFCDGYGACGPNGNCDAKKVQPCECLRGFVSKSPGGCVRNKPLNCKNDGFIKYISMKVPDTTNSWLNTSMTLNECREECSKNCSCMSYANSNISEGGSGCAMWFGDLNDIRVQPDGGVDIYVRVPASELENNHGHKWKIGVIVGSVALAISGLLVVLLCYRCRTQKNSKEKAYGALLGYSRKEQKEDLELPLFDLSTIATATDNFSIDNKLGEGGFGPVYKGKLEDGKEIAVKRLSRSSGQGLNEFKNEVILIARLQHRNLVKLLGCCIHDEEKLLIYEYMPNKSLDSFIFDQTQRRLLDWSRRYHIICGIARGLLYLHQDSRLRIIHRDLKASNVLLDSEMNPKISDFGLARTFGGDQSAGNTERVVGTYGYMAPEYAIDGNFSAKSDVFSFGILLLEIVTGKKNSGFYCPNDSLNLVEYAWNLWREERALELIDECIVETCNLSEVRRCIHISLLCMEQHPQDRPSMSSVVLMLGSDVALPQPQQPGFFIGEHSHGGFSSSPFKSTSPSINGLSITVLEAR